jgi:hypothetical protein
MDGLLLLLKMHREQPTLLTTDLVREAIVETAGGQPKLDFESELPRYCCRRSWVTKKPS